MKTFEAKYRGSCAACDDGIRVGERLAYDTDDQVVHVDCLDEARPSRKPPEICARCFLAKAENGACGCDDA